jgi:hypothetical protein
MRSEEVKKRNLAITSMSAMLLATVAISMITTTDNAFATQETGTSQEACEECFDGLSSDQQDNLVKEVGRQLFENPPMTLEEFCEAVGTLDAGEIGDAAEDIEVFLLQLGLNDETIRSIVNCFIRAEQ